MMSHGIRPPGKWNEAYVDMRTFPSPEALKAVKNFTHFKASMVYGGSLMNHLNLFVM